MGGIYDTYGTYSPGFIGVGTLGVLGALILAAITIALPPKKVKYKDHRPRRLSQLLPTKIGFYFYNHIRNRD